MGFIALKCPACGAEISLDETREFGFCQYCGTKIVQEKTIIEHRGSVSINHSEEIENLLKRADGFFEEGMYDKAEEYYNKVLDLDCDNELAKESLRKVLQVIDSPNLFIVREKARPSGEGKTILYIDGKKQKNANTDSSTQVILPAGEHTVYFKRAAVKSKEITVNIKNRHERFTINFLPQLFSIQVELLKKKQQ